MSDNAGTRNSELVEQLDDPSAVGADVDWMRQRTIAASIAEEIDDDQAVSGRHERHNVAPEMARRGEAVQEHDGFAGAACAGRVVIESRPAEIEELTSH